MMKISDSLTYPIMHGHGMIYLIWMMVYVHILKKILMWVPLHHTSNVSLSQAHLRWALVEWYPYLCLPLSSKQNLHQNNLWFLPSTIFTPFLLSYSQIWYQVSSTFNGRSLMSSTLEIYPISTPSLVTLSGVRSSMLKMGDIPILGVNWIA